MTITAYSKTFKRELDARQLKNLFDENNADSALSFRDFVKADIECPVDWPPESPDNQYHLNK